MSDKIKTVFMMIGLGCAAIALILQSIGNRKAEKSELDKMAKMRQAKAEKRKQEIKSEFDKMEEMIKAKAEKRNQEIKNTTNEEIETKTD